MRENQQIRKIVALRNEKGSYNQKCPKTSPF